MQPLRFGLLSIPQRSGCADADDFTPTRTNDFIDVCQPQKAADCDVSSLDGMTAQASSGRAINVIKGVPLVGDL